MGVLITSALKAALKSILVALLTEKFLKELIVFGLDKLAKSTENKVDDELLEKVKAALG